MGLPAKRYFWDVDPTALDPARDVHFIVRRLLEWGDVEEIRWLLAQYTPGVLREELKACRSLSKKSAVFWSQLLNVPLGDLECIRMRSDPQRVTAWPY